jgi:putative peptide zinc metalloprotease protein
MNKSLFSSLWYRVADIKPRLRSHTKIDRHIYRGVTWYVLQDNIAGRYHRFTPSAYYVIGLMDAKRSVQDIWELAIANLGEEAPTQDEVLQLLGQLNGADLLASDIAPDSLEIIERHHKQRFQNIKQRLMSPLAMRIALLDPEKLLNRFERFYRPCFSKAAAFIWFLVVGLGLVFAGTHFSELTSNLSDTVLSPANLLMLAFIFPMLKALHEFGHACATKVWGGEVHEMGIMFLIFMPVPYVNASSAASFRERYKRVVVGAAGMAVELFLAAIAMIIWVYVEPGLVRTAAYNVIFVGAVSTLLFNANPLLRFDGYYIFSDFLEIPNLASRANQYLGYLLQRYVFNVVHARSPVTAKGERFWFVFYAITSFIYRSMVMIGISIFVATEFFVVGVLLAVLGMVTMFVVPTLKHLWFVLDSPMLTRRRTRSIAITLGSVSAMIAVLGFYPAPHWTNAEGVIWMPESSRVRAGTDCFITEVIEPSARHEQNDSHKKNERHERQVFTGEPLFRCENPDLITEVRVLNAKIQEQQVQYHSQKWRDRVAAESTAHQLTTLSSELLRAKERLDDLIVKSPVAGTLSIPLIQDLPGKYISKGEVIAYVMPDQDTRVRVAVGQDDIALVHNYVSSIEIKFMHRPNEIVQGRLLREVPGASNQLPSMALGNQGGGDIAVDPRAEGGTTSFQKIFQYDVGLPAGSQFSVFGGRVMVRFIHSNEPLAMQGYRAIRQLFLGEFGV